MKAYYMGRSKEFGIYSQRRGGYGTAFSWENVMCFKDLKVTLAAVERIDEEEVSVEAELGSSSASEV